MSGKSQAYSDTILNVLNGTAVTGVTPYLGLFSAVPGDDSSPGIELTGNGYQRQRITFGAPVSGAGSVREIANARNIKLGPAASDWLQAVAFGIFDAQSAGNLLYWSTLAAPKIVPMGDFGQFAPGSLVVEED